MIIQQVIAFFFIALMVWRIILRFRRKEISNKEFFAWLIFWSAAAAAVLFLKQIDQWVRQLGFSGSGIEVLLYLAVALIFYLIFRVYARLDKMEGDITKIVREMALSSSEEKKQQ